MRILGISDHLTCGAAFIEDGRIVAAVNEERLARMKMVMGFPRKSISEVLDLAGVTADQVDYVAVASETGHFLNEYVDFSKGTYGIDEGVMKGLFFSVGARASFLRGRFPIIERIYYGLKQPLFAHRCRKIAQVMRDEFGIHSPVKFIPHHLAHAATAYYASGFEDGLIVTLDGAGDGHSSHVYDACDGNLSYLHSIPAFDSLGCYYAYATEICGYKAGKHEGKLTGLAAHGEPNYRDIFDRYIKYVGGSIRNVGNAYREAAIRKMRQELPNPFSKADLAATVQTVSEEIAVDFISHWRQRTNRRNVALAGGVFANVKINQRVHEIEGVDSVFVYPAMSDEGISAGAALVLLHEQNPAEIKRGSDCLPHVYLGRSFSDDEIRSALEAEEVDYVMPEDCEREIAQLIEQGRVVARFHGSMEYGPRALGNRSILYRPDEPAVNDWLNERLKRTEFMPFAPAVLAEEAASCFHGLSGAENTARFMTVTFDCTEEMKANCPGVVHIDGTARPQIVSESDNPSFYRIISEFKRLTGLPCVVNTSFNIHEEPIVCTPQDAIRAFSDGHLDVLAIGPFIAKNANVSEHLHGVGASDSVDA